MKEKHIKGSCVKQCLCVVFSLGSMVLHYCVVVKKAPNGPLIHLLIVLLHFVNIRVRDLTYHVLSCSIIKHLNQQEHVTLLRLLGS